MKPSAREPSARRGVLRAIAAIAVSAVQYQDQPKGSQRCSAHFIPGGQCKLVEGPISPNGWCIAYTAKS